MNVCAKDIFFFSKYFQRLSCQKKFDLDNLVSSDFELTDNKHSNKQTKFTSLELREGLLAQSSFVYMQMADTWEKAKFLPYFVFDTFLFNLPISV